MLGEDELPVQLDVEDSTAARDEFGRDVVFFLDLGRQTGGLRLVISTRAIRNSDVHFFLPRWMIVEPTSSHLSGLILVEAPFLFDDQPRAAPKRPIRPGPLEDYE